MLSLDLVNCFVSGRQNGLIGGTTMFYKGSLLQGDETVEEKNPNGPRNIDDLALKQNMYR